MRNHVLELAATEAKGMIITWPVNKHFAPLSVDPDVILGAQHLDDVTWHDIPARRWFLLTADEQTNLKVQSDGADSRRCPRDDGACRRHLRGTGCVHLKFRRDFRFRFGCS